MRSFRWTTASRRRTFAKHVMTRRSLLKVLALFPVVGPAIAKVLVRADSKSALGFMPYLPATFPKWDRALDGLEDPGNWAIGMERLRLPSTLVIPRVGEVWEAARDCEVTFVPCTLGKLSVGALSAFCMLGGTAGLRQGEKIRIVGLDHPAKPLRVSFKPLRYAELHAALVPEEVRVMPGYAGYQLSVKTAKTLPDFSRALPETFFNEVFRFVEPAA